MELGGRGTWRDACRGRVGSERVIEKARVRERDRKIERETDHRTYLGECVKSRCMMSWCMKSRCVLLMGLLHVNFALVLLV